MNAISYFLTAWVGLILAAPLVAAVIDLVRGKAYSSQRALALLYLRYLLRVVALNLGLILFLPLILLFLVIGPGALLAGTIAFAGLVIYFIEQVVGIDAGGGGLYSGDIQVGSMLGLFLFAAVSLYLFNKAVEANLPERWLNEIVARGRALLGLLDDWLPQ